MVVGILLVDCLLGKGRSLKEKRRYFLSLSQRLHNNFNCALAEIEGQNLWQRSRLILLTANSQSTMLKRTFDRILKFMEKEPYFQLLSYEMKEIGLNHFI